MLLFSLKGSERELHIRNGGTGWGGGGAKIGGLELEKGKEKA